MLLAPAGVSMTLIFAVTWILVKTFRVKIQEAAVETELALAASDHLAAKSFLSGQTNTVMGVVGMRRPILLVVQRMA